MEPLASQRVADVPVPSTADVRIIDGIKVVESPRGGPPPEGVPPWAVRCEIVEEPEAFLAWRPWILGASITVIVAGLIATWRGFNWGVAPVPLACVFLWLGWGMGSKGSTMVLRPTSEGRYLAFDDREPKDDSADRTLSIILGIVLLGCAALPIVGDEPDWLAAGAFGSFAIGLLYYGITGRWLNSNEPHIPPSTEQFRALADPRRPLDATSSAAPDTEKELP